MWYTAAFQMGTMPLLRMSTNALNTTPVVSHVVSAMPKATAAWSKATSGFSSIQKKSCKTRGARLVSAGLSWWETGVRVTWCTMKSSKMMASTRETPCARDTNPSVAFCNGMMKFCAVAAHLAALAAAAGSPPPPENFAACFSSIPCMLPPSLCAPARAPARAPLPLLAAAAALVITR